MLPLTLTHKNTNFRPTKKHPKVEDNIVSIAQHRATLATRFPKVDDVLDRLSADARTARLSLNKNG